MAPSGAASVRPSSLVALWLTFPAILRNPLLALSRIPWESADLVAPLVLCVSAGIVSHVGVVLGALLFADVEALLGPHFAEMGVSPYAGALLGLTAVPLTLTLQLFVTSAMAHGLLGLTGGARRPYAATFRVFAYAGVPSLLGLVPVIGGALATLMTLLMLLLGLRVAHGATTGQAFAGAAPAFVGVFLGAWP